MNILNLMSELNFEIFSNGINYNGADVSIGKLFHSKNIGFHLEILNPKSFSCPYHYHEKEEELCIVMEGDAILRQNNQYRKIKTGDLVYFATGPENAHHIYNHSDKPLKFFVLSTQDPDEICHYPDSLKIFDVKARKVTQNGMEVDYWKDEENPGRNWPANALQGKI